METSTVTANKTIARLFFENFQKGDVKQVENLWGSNYKLHFPGSPQPMGKTESKELLEEYSKAFPDIKYTIESQIGEGDFVVTRINASGTHKGTFQGIPATNKKVTFTGTATHKVVNGKIEEEWAEFDAMGLMTQIGAVSQPALSRY